MGYTWNRSIKRERRIRIKKKILSLALTLVLSLSLAVPALAVSVTEIPTDYASANLYGQLPYFSEGLAAVENADGLYGFIDKTGKEVIPCQYYHAEGFSDGLAVVTDCVNFHEGYIDRNGNVVIPFQYDLAFSFSEGLAAVRYYWPNGLWDEGFIDKTGVEIVPHKYKNVRPFQDGIAFAANASDKTVILKLDKNGQPPVPSVPEVPVDPNVPTVSGFTDVRVTDFFADAVKWAADSGVASGTTANTFSPERTCTTAEILTLLWRASGSPKATASAAVPAGQYYTDAANWAVEKGLTDGFSADTPATRAATVTYLWKLAGKPTAGTTAFTDVDAGAEYAQAVAWAVEELITAGTAPGTFSPDKTCTRGEIVTFLYRDLA